MQPQDLEIIINGGEDDHTEFKKTLSISNAKEKAEFIKDMLALANAHGEEKRYLIVGVENRTLVKHDVTFLNLDDNDLQQIIEGYVEPQISFTYREVAIDSVQLGVITINSSTQRFHLVKKDLFTKIEDRDTALLSRGQIWIRRGARCSYVTARDFQLLRDNILQTKSNTLSPRVIITHKKKVLITKRSGVFSTSKTPFTLTFDLAVNNRGHTPAMDVIAFIQLPGDCATVKIAPESRNSRLIQNSSEAEYRIQIPKVTHHLRYLIGPISINIPDKDKEYTLTWTTHADNMPEMGSGEITLNSQDSSQVDTQ